MLVWWYNTSAAQSGRYPLVQVPRTNPQSGSSKNMSGLDTNVQNAQHSSAALCDEIVETWRLLALDPTLTDEERRRLREQLVRLTNKRCFVTILLQIEYHRRSVELLWRSLTHPQVMVQSARGKMTEFRDLT